MKRTKGNKTAVLILDMLNRFDFPEADQLLPFAEKAAAAIAKLKVSAKKHQVPVIYVNDHFGKWHSDWNMIFAECTQKGRKGKEIAETLRPDKEDYFILKPKHSGFYLTALELLLESLNVEQLILTGIAGNLCVLFTANDAHMRNYKVVVPKDCTASNTKKDNEFALHHIQDVLKLSTRASRSLRFS